MAPLPLGRLLAQVIVPLVAVLARAIPAAYSQALQNARRNGVDATKTASDMLTRNLSKSEALQILNLTEAEATAEAVQKQFEKYFNDNAVEKGGSFYLQSKVYRAKELMDDYLKEKKSESQESSKEEKSKQ
mmetsp:Transcript_30487/g.45118  ORF Transcript_30487/g.45118 Transcript_30487/m.45118 type:complete len:131 (-) Transcript_30487:627-1019(-)|eukprot:CAMPEP_0194199214 /NCGR_PEP_ID=MMETSP0156-20130528/312_1 /TAXON_ID=33649 /ORGANISM="Thalassionema nitzschioides, Strain L26-B" /LENGTH=130 /DNA_ID=CAMNT_0038924073 /DNA_START=105 /DNA_END=497 /DNA_ORIENTATION=-